MARNDTTAMLFKGLNHVVVLGIAVDLKSKQRYKLCQTFLIKLTHGMYLLKHVAYKNQALKNKI